MRMGKLQESLLRRSVLRRIHPDASLSGREFYGADCAFLDGRRDTAYVSVCAVPGFERCPGKLVVSAANGLYAGGFCPAGLMVQALLPESYEEAGLQRDMEEIREAAAEQGMEILGGHTQVTDMVREAVYTVTGIGTVQEAARRALCPGDELVLTKWIALGGTAALALQFERELKARFPSFLVDRAKGFEELMTVAEDARVVNCFSQAAVHDLSQGGIFGALREMAEHAGVGLEVDLRKIPVRQETIEICEFFDINPYELYSAGALLVGTEHGQALVRELELHGVPAAVIGQVTEGNGRIIRNGEDIRYLDRAPQDAWYGIQKEKQGKG